MQNATCNTHAPVHFPPCTEHPSFIYPSTHQHVHIITTTHASTLSSLSSPLPARARARMWKSLLPHWHKIGRWPHAHHACLHRPSVAESAESAAAAAARCRPDAAMWPCGLATCHLPPATLAVKNGMLPCLSASAVRRAPCALCLVPSATCSRPLLRAGLSRSRLHPLLPTYLPIPIPTPTHPYPCPRCPPASASR